MVEGLCVDVWEREGTVRERVCVVGAPEFWGGEGVTLGGGRMVPLVGGGREGEGRGGGGLLFAVEPSFK